MFVKSKITKKQWTEYYSKIPGITPLIEDGNDYLWIGYDINSNTFDLEKHTEVIDENDLLKIKKHREVYRIYPQPNIK